MSSTLTRRDRSTVLDQIRDVKDHYSTEGRPQLESDATDCIS